ncbi:hypothetical protein SPRG_11228 [Saprolegnia parasitica CBS 223.65]|uniref:Uncharacterized protein n=1 Tax=Saprolegnia parasitica (strain CBS 223.65) TaxID=695850 RepID=A0A067BZV8_SAPPC|nr:hypothetical protein SPRG_11228 [Saprolegnia parasitica CBS 223.65]KDO23798.1 hypothetical protein SPRG_11228 [Saprolegnia parasitica CBS 223.65]|eukprot:XP_012205434.1 hypothetical protein SPRG_11228 [Saprolegnia parasitica CBS 223.65]
MASDDGLQCDVALHKTLRRRELEREWYQKHRCERLQKQRGYDAKNRAKRLQQMKAYRHKHRDRQREYKQEWYRRNRDAIKQKRLERKAAIEGHDASSSPLALLCHAALMA